MWSQLPEPYCVLGLCLRCLKEGMGWARGTVIPGLEPNNAHRFRWNTSFILKCTIYVQSAYKITYCSKNESQSTSKICTYAGMYTSCTAGLSRCSRLAGASGVGVSSHLPAMVWRRQFTFTLLRFFSLPVTCHAKSGSIRVARQWKIASRDAATVTELTKRAEKDS